MDRCLEKRKRGWKAGPLNIWKKGRNNRRKLKRQERKEWKDDQKEEREEKVGRKDEWIDRRKEGGIKIGLERQEGKKVE